MDGTIIVWKYKNEDNNLISSIKTEKPIIGLSLMKFKEFNLISCLFESENYIEIYEFNGKELKLFQKIELKSKIVYSTFYIDNLWILNSESPNSKFSTLIQISRKK